MMMHESSILHQAIMASMIMAQAENNVIGDSNRLPWRLPTDLKKFKERTLHHAVIMGRATWESLSKPLPQRTNIVLTTQAHYSAKGAEVVHSIADAFSCARKASSTPPMIIGGAEVYRQCEPYVNRLYLTRVHTKIAGDTKFCPSPDWQEEATEEAVRGEKDEYAMSFITLVKPAVPL